jgi:tetratricopeptide (TPR) repeat protein
MSWKEPEFQKRFLGRYGVDGFTEPLMDVENFNLYEGAMAQMESKEAVFNYLESGMETLAAGGLEVSPALYFVLGSVAYELDRKEEAVEHYIAAIRGHPSFLRAYANLGFTFMELGEQEKALPVLIKAVELGGNESQIHGLIGYIYLQEELYRSALTAYEWAIVFNPRNNAWRQGTLQCLIGLDQWDEAKGVAEEILEFDKDNHGSWSNLANILIKLNRFDDAIVYLNAAVALGDNRFSTWRNMAGLYWNKGIVEGTDRALSEAIGVVATEEELELSLSFAHSLSSNQHHETALSLLDLLKGRANELDLSLDPVIAGLIEVGGLIEAESYPDAEIQLRELSEIEPAHGEIQLLLARVLAVQNRLPEAESAYELAATFPGTEYLALYEHARIKLMANDVQAALELLREAYGIEPSPELSSYIDNLEGYRN